MASGASDKIEEFLAVLDAHDRDPTPHESYYVLRAITALAQGYGSLAEADIDRAIRPRRPPKFGKGRRSRLTEIAVLPCTRAELRRHWRARRPRVEVTA